ncbi:DUF4983 domain-containing protein [Pedobacter sp. LMG 31464]|uniref:DUF4983 domain-containing protein n=1 Tax=Pedobacter planticolens TaxID=2679964 RepID=A0A923DXK1_9SPHI|nr:LamG-like jellyroll fold domain-containing protein [Pedobacter planticolens]MBB2144500.1 DUF4983 domain-containing protein [Pedobacter planticolens]
MKINYKKAILFSALITTTVTGFISCKKYDNPPPVFEEPITRSTIQRKVIVISIDGLTGAELKTIAPPAIGDLRKTSKYTYDVIRGSVANDVASWASMINGVSYSRHLIKTDDFLPTPKENSHESPGVFRNAFDYILQYKSLKTAIVTPWPNLRNYLRIADFAPIVSTDVAVKDSTINILNTKTQLGAMVVNFRDVEAAGANGGFVASNTVYKNAVLKADEYVGNIVAAIKARKSYANEDWLIIVTTNHGGSNDDPKAGFLIASQKNLKEELIKKSGFNTVNFKTDNVYATVPVDNGLYDFGTDKDFTVQMDTKFNSSASYPQFLGKSTSNYTGWFWMQEGGNQWNLEFGGVNNGGGGKQQLGIAVALTSGWHTLTMTVKYVNATTRTASAYVDGVFKSSYNVSASKNINTSELLRLGARGTTSGTTDFHAANLEIFNVALDATTITANKDLKDITKHPNYTNLIGYWPIDEGSEGIIGNKAPSMGYDMVLAGNYTWTALGTNVPATVAPDLTSTGKSIVLTPTTVGATMLYWLNIDILPAFGIDGSPFLNQFEIEFLK